MRLSLAARGAALAAVALWSVSCGAEGSQEQPAEGHDDAELQVVTSIDVYADLAQQVVGDTAEVEALVDNPAVDPHSYEATPQDRLQVNEADVVIANGGGYDAFITLLASAAGIDDDVYQLIEGANEHSHGGEGYENEHIWYDLERMSQFVTDFGEHMSAVTPENAELYSQNAAELAGEIDQLDERNRALEAEELDYFATEPVSQFLLVDAGFEDRTEEEFLAAVEHGDDVSPRLYQRSLELVSSDELSLLAYNSQTETNQSQRLREAAEDADVPVLEFSETLPDDAEGYLDWMEANIDRVESLIEDADG